ncbi:MAG: hypothetical protein NUV77_08965 [Thermoguttaceae bacterium]|nr:hypothetical protein [Thermoguttaceae bacterium]
MTAAALKAHQLLTEPVLGFGLLESRWFLLGVVLFEACLGVWLLLTVLARVSWAVALAVFVIFACVSAYKGIAGEMSCGCLGRVKASPWIMVGMDMLIVALLVRCRPAECMRRPPEGVSLPSLANIGRRMWALRGAFSVAAVLAGVFCVWAVWRFGSAARGLAYLAGYAVVPEVDKAQVARVPAGVEASIPVGVLNLRRRAVVVVGAKGDCGCIATDGLPVLIEPRGVAPVRLRFTAPKDKVGQFVTHKAQLYLDVPTMPVVVSVTAEIVEPLDTDGVTQGDVLRGPQDGRPP